MPLLPFLKEVATEIYAKHRAELPYWQIVLPSRRAARYFQHYLTELTVQPLLAPDIVSMDDFVRRLSRLQVPPQVNLLLRLYDTYKTYDTNPKHSLERFTPLGLTLLKDFSMIDKNLPEARALTIFEYLKDVKALERWGENLGNDYSPERYKSVAEYFAFWEYLEKTYINFRSTLLAEGLAYSGLAYRKVHESLEELIATEGVAHVAFVGFAQMTGAEEDIMRTLLKINKASTFWDADAYYMQHRWHEAGDYIRKYQTTWLSQPIVFPNHLQTHPKEIRFVEAPNELSQARYAGQLIGEEIEAALRENRLDALRKTVNHTAILLPDGAMLGPVLHALPDYSAQGFPTANYLNITMGTSLRNTQLADFVQLMFQMQERTLRGNAQKIYYKDLEYLLAHPYLLFETDTQQVAATLLSEIRTKNKAYIPLKELLAHCPAGSLLHKVFTPWKGEVFAALENLKDISEWLSAQFADEEGSLEQELLFHFYTLLNNLQKSFSERKDGQLKLHTFRYFLLELMKNQSVPFSGEPISPFQIMGMLESRTLDFQHVIVLSCNEGILPKGKVLDSVVPFGMRLQYQLPSHQENDGSFAYTFYRLLQRAERVTLLYQASNGQRSKEPSRFIQQMENEWKNHSNIQFSYHKIHLTAPEFNERVEEVIEKDEEIIAKIREILKRGRSPSAINTYIKSPLEFFYKSLLKLEDPKMVEEYLDHRTFGTMLHETLDRALKPHIGLEIGGETLQKISRDEEKLRVLLAEGVLAQLGEVDIDTGKNYLLKETALDLIGQFLRYESRELPYMVIALERAIGANTVVNVPHTQEPMPVRVSGFADRIDLQRLPDGRYHLRVVDYKTGSFDPKALKSESLAELFTVPEKSKIVQLMLYKFIVIRLVQAGELPHLPPDFSLERDQISAGFFFFRQLSAGYVQYTLGDAPANNFDFAEYVEKFLHVFASDLLNISRSFTETPSDFEPYISAIRKS